MRIRDIIDYLRPDMNVIVRDYAINDHREIEYYNGNVEDMPYWVAEKEFTAHECIEVQNNSIIIDTSKPARSIRNKDVDTNQKWLDTLSEEENLLYLGGFLYHYDSGIAHDESFDNDEWLNVFNPMIDYVEKRIGRMSFDEKMHDWFRSNPSKK